ncbi:MAG: hypothetical protein WCL14_08255, partial [Bacteroidota bacterium]
SFGGAPSGRAVPGVPFLPPSPYPIRAAKNRLSAPLPHPSPDTDTAKYDIHTSIKQKKNRKTQPHQQEIITKPDHHIKKKQPKPWLCPKKFSQLL